MRTLTRRLPYVYPLPCLQPSLPLGLPPSLPCPSVSLVAFYAARRAAFRTCSLRVLPAYPCTSSKGRQDVQAGCRTDGQTDNRNAPGRTHATQHGACLLRQAGTASKTTRHSRSGTQRRSRQGSTPTTAQTGHARQRRHVASKGARAGSAPPLKSAPSCPPGVAPSRSTRCNPFSK
jgi:hypothetical protein